MGCTQSKIENEESVARCKERKLHMTEAVSARNAFAAAHSLYTMALKNTGAALSDYAHGEFQLPPSAVSGGVIPAVSQPSYDSLPPPPPPLPNFPLQHAATMPEFSIPIPELSRSDPIIEEGEEEEEEEEENFHNLKHPSTRSGGGVKSGSLGNSEVELPIPPPSPPRTPPLRDREPPPPPPRPEMNGMSWDFFFPSMENVPGPSLAEVDESRIEREEMESKAFEERTKMAAEAERKAKEAEAAREKERQRERERVVELPQPPAAAAKVVKKVRHVAGEEGKRPGKPGNGGSVNLLQVFSDLDDCFLKAFESAHEVSKMLEANRLHYHSNFADNRGD